MNNRPLQIQRVRPTRRLLRLALIVAGIMLLAMSFSFNRNVPPTRHLAWFVAISGIGYVAAGWLLNRLPAVFMGVGVSLVSLFLSVMIIESVSRLIQHEYPRQHKWSATPICYRQPVYPVGDVFFRRPGPDRWTGNVLATHLSRQRVAGWESYADTGSITVEYDHQGFRNPAELLDWDIAIVGDSFTELGYLPDDQMFSTRLADELNVSVRNLGVSYTGTLTHNFYLKEYGRSKSTRIAVLIFFEGNDLKDIKREYAAIEKFRRTGEREYREIRRNPQHSFLVYAAFTVSESRQSSEQHNGTQPVGVLFQPGVSRVDNATLQLDDESHRVTIAYAPGNQEDLSAEDAGMLDEAIAQWSSTAQTLDLEPWLAFMPCKHRVFAKRLKFDATVDASLADWQPSDFPEHIASLCSKHAIEFVDLTPDLIAETDQGRITYNLVWDTHLNRDGAVTVAQTLTTALREHVVGSRHASD